MVDQTRGDKFLHLARRRRGLSCQADQRCKPRSQDASADRLTARVRSAWTRVADKRSIELRCCTAQCCPTRRRLSSLCWVTYANEHSQRTAWLSQRPGLFTRAASTAPADSAILRTSL